MNAVHTLRNTTGLCVRFMAMGGIVLSVDVPDRTGQIINVTPGYGDPATYELDTNYLGALIGRYANRIAEARFTLDGVAVQLDANDGTNHLHGGRRGFHRRLWAVSPRHVDSGTAADLTYTSVAGEEGYPGTLAVHVIYHLTDDDSLDITYTATTDAPTVVNLTQHLYLNLAGAGTILDHELAINASRFTPVDAALIPTGELRSVTGTPFDFTSARRIGERIAADDDQLRHGRGYDHTLVLDDFTGGALRLAARLMHRHSGRMVELFTTEPGLHFYSGQLLTAPRGLPTSIGRHSALALEPQHFPDSPNRRAFPATILRPGDTYRSRTVYRFSVAG
ncbi:MAG: aldose epimerase family protein [Gemmatimonadaceae bacterium]